jgi:hypothetical protein
VSSENQAGASPAGIVPDVKNSLETYRTIAEWIRFADAKAGVTLTVNGLMLGLLIPTLKSYLTDKTATHPFEGWTALVVFLFVVWLVFVVLSAVNSFLCILPIRGASKQLALAQTTHFHPAAVSLRYSLSDFEKFIADCEQIGTVGFNRQVLAAILIDSHLSNAKYRFVSRSIWGLAASVVFGFLYLMAIQF